MHLTQSGKNSGKNRLCDGRCLLARRQSDQERESTAPMLKLKLYLHFPCPPLSLGRLPPHSTTDTISVNDGLPQQLLYQTGIITQGLREHHKNADGNTAACSISNTSCALIRDISKRETRYLQPHSAKKRPKNGERAHPTSRAILSPRAHRTRLAVAVSSRAVRSLQLPGA